VIWKLTWEVGGAKGRPRTERSGGASLRVRSVAVLTAATRPDQVVGLAVLGIEQVGVDGGVEARIVELDREVVAALVGALGPGGPDLGAADEDRWEGALSLVRLDSGTMRTFLACTLRVTISP
jgi:hypothetical protein